MNIFFTLTIVLAIATAAHFIAVKINIPSVVGLIIAGIIIGLPGIESFIIGKHSEFLVNLGDIGLLTLMFLAGLETSWHLLYEEKTDAALIAIFGALTPFFLGFAVFRLLGYSLAASLITGICMSITAEATKAKVLLELDKLKTRLGAAMMGAGIIDDTLGFLLFVGVTLFVHAENLKEDILIIGALGMFFLGIIIQKFIKREHKSIQIIEKTFTFLIIPFFFISMGMHFELKELIINPVLLLIIILIGVSGKLIGTMLTKPFINFRWKQLFLAGWAMNSRGAVELALALIAFRTGLIPARVYSGLIVMGLIATLSFPFVITHMINKDSEVMD